MLSHRQQYRILQTAFVFALIGVAFFGAYQGSRPPQPVETHSAADHDGKKHPPFLTRDYLTEDPVGFATFGLTVFTALLFGATVWVALDARKSSAAALEASTRATETLIATERPYVTGGGGTEDRTVYSLDQDDPDNATMRLREARKKLFLVDVANYGKTPALLKHYVVQFATFNEVKAGPLEITPRYKHRDWLAPGHENRKRLKEIDIPYDKDVVFGGFWYSDFQKQEHCFRFILSIDPDTTRPNIADLVDASYMHWD
jgi:hypothetical protein